MSVIADIGQLLWLGFEGTRMPDELATEIGSGECGGVVLFRRNLVITPAAADEPERVDLEALAALNHALHAAAGGAPLLVAVDQEGGSVQRVRAPATRWPPMMSFDGLPTGRDEELAEKVGYAMGCELAALGFDVDFAPVLDVHTNPQNPVIGDRAFARDAEAVARRALAWARGLDRAGVLGCGKHFPGHGDTATDSHLELPRIDHTWDRLDAVELLPFRRAAEAGLPMIMTAHVVFAALDAKLPATLSPIAIGLLRDKLQYQGVIVSDDLDMRAIADHYGVGHAAVTAVRAGCDVLLLCRDRAHQVEAKAALLAAAEKDAGFRSRVAQAAARVSQMKARHQRRRAAAIPDATLIGGEAHRRLAAELAGR